MERNPLKMSNPEMSDFPPEVLVIIFNGTDLNTKKELRLVCKSWKQIIDSSQVVNFCVRSMRTLTQLNTFMDSSVKEFSLVQMEFTWGVKYPKYLLKDGFNFNIHTIKELVFAKPSYKRDTAYAHTIGDSQVLKFFINFLKSGCHGVEQLKIQSEIMAHFIAADLERALSSSVQWNTVQKLSLAVSTRRNHEPRCPKLCFAPLQAFLKFSNIPNLNNVRIEVRSLLCSGDEILHRSVLISLIVDICKFLLRYKQTLRHVFLLFDRSHHTLDLEKHLCFMEGEDPFQLESFILDVRNAESDALGYIAAICTEGPTILKTFGYGSCNSLFNTVATGNLIIANERLERILSHNGSTIEDLTLDMRKVNFNLFRHCPNLKTLKFGDVHEMNFQEWSSKFPNITRLKIQNECFLKPEFLNWLLAHCPDLTFLEIRTPWNDFARRNPFLFVSIQSILLTFHKLKEILLFEQPHMFPCVETQSLPQFECVRKIHPSTSKTYLSILVRNHNM